MKELMLCVPVVIKTSNFKIISRCHLADYVNEVYFSASSECSAPHCVSVTIFNYNFSLYFAVYRTDTYHMKDKMTSKWLWTLKYVVLEECMCKHVT